MHRLAIKQMHAIHRGAPSFEEGRNMQRRIEGAELLSDHLRLQNAMTAQGGVTATDHNNFRC